MDTCTFLLLCSLLNWMSPFAAGSCTSYTTINEPRRHVSLPSVPPYLDDSGLVGSWLRFVGEGGDVLSFVCYRGFHGGSEHALVSTHNYNMHGSGLFTIFVNNDGVCSQWQTQLEVMKCPEGFFVYRPLSHPPQTLLPGKFSWTTVHSNCSKPNICGTSPRVYCGYHGICGCLPGFELASVPTLNNYDCVDIDECATSPCVANANCTNYDGGFSCECLTGFTVTDGINPPASNNPCTDVDECLGDVCGDNEICLNSVGSFVCVCATGYENVTGGTEPPCRDIDECLDTTICVPNSVCANEPGTYNCSCQEGFSTFNNAPPASNNPCQDVEECVDDPDVCGPEATCNNTLGSYICTCTPGYRRLTPAVIASNANPCSDVDECLGDVCGDNEICLNSVGSFVCVCATGYENVTGGTEPPCRDTDECLDTTICVPNSVCANEPGTYTCSCQEGFSTFNNAPPASNNPCQDIDECSETPDICGFLGVCTNVPGLFHCSCLEGSYPNTGVLWTMGVTDCRAIPDILDEIVPPEGQTAEMTFLRRVDLQLRDNLPKGLILPDVMVANCLSACMEVAGVGHRVDPVRVSSAGDGESGSLIQDITKLLMITLVPPDLNQTIIRVTTKTLDMTLYAFGPGIHKSSSISLSANGNLMEINLKSLGRNNNGSAAVAFLVLHDMESLLSHQYFETENRTEMMSDVIMAELPKMSNTELTEPVNFTVMHNKKPLPESGLVNCVYWNITTQQLMELLSGEGDEDEEADSMEWSEEGCWVSHTNENYTVCSCSHLSTFALILQTGEPPPQSDFLDWLNRICVIIGLFFFALAILTFLLCSWNPKINNTARLHLCVNLGLSHLLLLFNDVYVADKRACKAMAGILHFVVVASFVWMLLEAVQLYMLVRRLNKVQVIERDGLPLLVLFLIGYGVPLVIVGVSAVVYHPGYGATAAKVCWLSQTRDFNWALTGPVIVILALNFLLFGATLWSLRTTLANMRSGASDSKETKLVLFKIVAQFVILGCTWILGLFQTNLFFQILFIVLNSQQGTFLYIVHCVLNKEIREECLRRFTCSEKKKKEKSEEQSTSDTG